MFVEYYLSVSGFTILKYLMEVDLQKLLIVGSSLPQAKHLVSFSSIETLFLIRSFFKAKGCKYKLASKHKKYRMFNQ
tara:strand:+ start:1961 stop:2191 length:231 start_codon:yes stop_codon:yes gene_type:complete